MKALRKSLGPVDSSRVLLVQHIAVLTISHFGEAPGAGRQYQLTRRLHRCRHWTSVLAVPPPNYRTAICTAAFVGYSRTLACHTATLDSHRTSSTPHCVHCCESGITHRYDARRLASVPESGGARRLATRSLSRERKPLPERLAEISHTMWCTPCPITRRGAVVGE